MEGVVSALTFANLVYVMRKEFAPELIEDVLKKARPYFPVYGIKHSGYDKCGWNARGRF